MHPVEPVATAAAADDTSSLIRFRFSAEELVPEKRAVAEGDAHGAIPTDSFLFQSREGTRLDYVTNARQHGVKWYPELNHSVVNVFADTYACWPFRCPRFGCSRPVNCIGCYCYRVSFTRAQWLWTWNLLCLLAHATMAYLCFTACNGNRFGVAVNPNCTATNMEVNVYRFTSNCMCCPSLPTHAPCEHPTVLHTGTSARASGYTMMTKVNDLPVRFDLLAGWFHALSAIFHAFPVIVGPFDRFAFAYWKYAALPSDRTSCMRHAPGNTPFHAAGYSAVRSAMSLGILVPATWLSVFH